MKLQNLRAFVAILRSGSVTGAANELNLTQPAVSRMLGALETDIGFRLFFREHGRLTPTNEGRRFFEKCEPVLAGVEGLAEVAKEISAYRDGVLTILCTPQSGYTIFPRVLSRFSEKHPKIKLNLHIVQRDSIAGASITYHYDVGFTALPFDQRNLTVRSIFTLPALAVVPGDGNATHNLVLTPEDFQNQDFIALTPDNLIRRQADLFFTSNRIKVRSVVETSSPLIAYMLVLQGMGISIVDPFSPMFMASKKVRVCQVAADIRLTYGFFVPDNRPISVLAESAIQIFQDVTKEAYPSIGI